MGVMTTAGDRFPVGASQKVADLSAMIGADFSGLDFEARQYVAKGSLGLAGMMGDNFHTVEHRDGVPWSEAPLPRRRHRCTVWTSEWFGLSQVCRCACGASIENIVQRWSGKNARRKRR